MRGLRWIVGIGALFVAIVALYLLVTGRDRSAPGRVDRPPSPIDPSEIVDERSGPPLDDIDAKSRAKMRELLRENP